MIQRIKMTVAVVIALALALIAITPAVLGVYYIGTGTFSLATVDEDQWVSQFETPVYYAEVQHGFVCLLAAIICVPALGFLACKILDYADKVSA
jgi:hypothetical protein